MFHIILLGKVWGNWIYPPIYNKYHLRESETEINDRSLNFVSLYLTYNPNTVVWNLCNMCKLIKKTIICNFIELLLNLPCLFRLKMKKEPNIAVLGKTHGEKNNRCCRTKFIARCSLYYYFSLLRWHFSLYNYQSCLKVKKSFHKWQNLDYIPSNSCRNISSKAARIRRWNSTSYLCFL